nr:immunoglobulin heavy chain junction region [Macaca mulatta]MOV36504.1 immunoglobulin heavy chain junction region [Macaca mulatta]MOV36580.1 immunoglobulin heavy chain junction region [Macaca mulatta]MOV36707.1 immunoglobulin heavy chain junction region [Macaca mulatta]MOV38324.1 immunoglobulin heavy chain junction region [Macaca mulatta]
CARDVYGSGLDYW